MTISPYGARLLIKLLGIDYDETYSLVIDVIALHYPVSLVVSK